MKINYQHTKQYIMQKNIYGLLMIALFAASCGNAKKDSSAEVTDKKVKLEQLKKEQGEIGLEIKELETEIARLDPNSGKNENAKLVALTAIEPGGFEHFIELQGRVDARNISYVAPPNGQGGIVKALYVTQGQNVRKGQVLARLDDQLIRQQIDPIRVQLTAAEDTYRRTKTLFDQGIGTYQQVLTAQTQVESLKKNIAIIQRQAALMTVTAPSSGVADQVNVRVGEAFVGSTPAGPQIRIVNTNDLKIVASVPENYLSKVSVGSKLKIILPDQNRELDAVVNVVQKLIDPNSRSFNIEARIPGSTSLKPNQIAQVKILDYSANNVVTIPVNVIQTDEKGKYVYVAENAAGKMTARKKTIITGEFYGDRIEVKSGLTNGEQLITDGYQNLYEGQAITTTLK